ncbi:MAG: hypothetical protein HC933_09965, partial [Pleurocapsa sp. SU_196_0]|nr:hypothetical protein [Pleurocapsa sp. SU_196_0]
MPLGIDEVEPVDYPLLSETFTMLGQTFIGSRANFDAAARERMNKLNAEFREMLINLLPVIGSVKVFIEGVKKCMDATNQGKRCNALGLILEGIGVIADSALIGRVVTLVG